jgi:hypothetical protein
MADTKTFREKESGAWKDVPVSEVIQKVRDMRDPKKGQMFVNRMDWIDVLLAEHDRLVKELKDVKWEAMLNAAYLMNEIVYGEEYRIMLEEAHAETNKLRAELQEREASAAGEEETYETDDSVADKLRAEQEGPSVVAHSSPDQELK